MLFAHTNETPADSAREEGGFALVVLCYALALFHRTAFQSILPAITGEFNVGAVELAGLSVAFFWVCIAGIVVAGPLTDVFGTRPVCTAGVLLVAAGSLAFAGGDSYGSLVVARALISAGCATTFVAMMRFALLACRTDAVVAPGRAVMGRAIMIGNLAALAWGATLAVALASFDWRLVWIVLGLAATALAAFVWTLVPDAGSGGGLPSEHSLRAAGRAIRLSVRAAWQLAASSRLLAGAVYVGGLAGGFYGFADAVAPGLLATHGFVHGTAGWALGALAAGHAVGALAWARSADNERQRGLSLVAAPAGAFTCWYGMLFLSAPSPTGLVMLLVGAGFFSGAFVLAYMPVVARHPATGSGGAVAIVTVGIALATGLVTVVAGALTPIHAMGLLLLCALLSLVFSRWLGGANPAASDRGPDPKHAPLQVAPDLGSAPDR